MTLAQRVLPLTLAQRELLWTVAQHKYGWTHVSNRGSQRTLQVARALERRGLVTVDKDRTHPTCAATEEGRAEIAWRWPISPFNLGTYEHQPYGWDPRPTAENCDGSMGGPWFPGVQCYECFRFVGHDGRIDVEHFEMSSTIASVEGTCRRCLKAKAT